MHVSRPCGLPPPPQVTISLLQRAMDESGSTKPFLIDGFPRNEENRSQFEKQVGARRPVATTCVHTAAVSGVRTRRALGSSSERGTQVAPVRQHWHEPRWLVEPKSFHHAAPLRADGHLPRAGALL